MILLLATAALATPDIDARDLAKWIAACQDGNGGACLQLGLSYAQGAPPVVPVNLGEADRWLDRACAAGVPEGCFALGAVRETVARKAEDADLAPADAAYRTACEGEVILACAARAALIERGEVDGDAVALRERSCAAAHAESCLALGAHREDGRDPEGALAAYEDACEAGGVGGCAALGAMLLVGPRRLRDGERGRTHLAAACDAGLAQTCGVLGDTTDDAAEALARWRQGCEGDDPWSCWQASRALKRTDAVSAQALLERACGLGWKRRCPR